MLYSENIKDYYLLDAGDCEKLEVWGPYILRRPDPMAIWKKQKPELWDKADAIYHRSKTGGGYWEFKKKLPEKWHIHYKDLTFKVSPTNFKHTGIFPEQAANWDFIYDKLKDRPDAKVLNLFAYSGAATTVAASAGISEVVHVDASKGMVEWAKENRDLSNLQNTCIRYIVEDCLKFMKREVRRGRKYDGIIMDPPSYGRGPNNEIFKFEEQIGPLIEEAAKLLSDDPLFLIVNTYTTGYSCTTIENVLRCYLPGSNLPGSNLGSNPHGEEIGVKMKDIDFFLPCGFTTRWTK